MRTARLLGAASQATFDAIMRSISEPGTIRQIPSAQRSSDIPDIASLALALADVDVTVAANLAATRNSQPPITELVADATGATITDLDDAWIALLDQPTPAEMQLLSTGSALEPELAARVAIAVDGLSRTRHDGWTELVLSGPGVPGQRSLWVSGVDPAVLQGLGQASGHFPAGLDTWLFDPNGQVAAIPRSTTVTTVTTVTTSTIETVTNERRQN